MTMPYSDLTTSTLKKLVIMVALVCAASTAVASAEIEQLRAHNSEFKRHIYKVAPNVYTGVGYGGSNASMIVGETGVIFVDTLPATSSASELHEDFRRISDKPVKAIIFTHGHVDHVGGASVFAQDEKPAIYAQANFDVDRADAARGTIFAKRGARQFGRQLEPLTERINLGVGPAVQPMKGFGQGILKPTVTFEGEYFEVKVDSINVNLFKAPGETDDQLYVWLPNEKVLFSGDNFYHSFPNLYALRGGPYRDVLQWANSVKKMAAHPALALVPGHTKPVIGAERVNETLTNYHEAIQFVHDKTLEGMNKGMTPDQLVDYVKLPPELARQPYLTEYYGRVDTAVRAIFSGYLGWFSGNPTQLASPSQVTVSRQIANLAGGEQALLAALDKAMDERNYAWSLMLADYLIALETYSMPATRIKIQALRALADGTLNAPTRNYYLSVARELAEATR